MAKTMRIRHMGTTHVTELRINERGYLQIVTEAGVRSITRAAALEFLTTEIADVADYLAQLQHYRRLLNEENEDDVRYANYDARHAAT